VARRKARKDVAFFAITMNLSVTTGWTPSEVRYTISQLGSLNLTKVHELTFFT
jgi:hypothetical protein